MNGCLLRFRCLVVWLAASGVVGGVVALVLPTAGVGVAGPFDEALVRLASLVLLGCAAWGWVVTTLVVLATLRGAVSRVPAPAVVRRLVLAACGAALSTGLAAPALAHGDPSPAGLPFPDRAVGGRPAATAASTATSVVVRPGDTLWSMAASRLPAGASNRAVAAACERLYQLNRDVIGDDPDLIEPGQHLAVPSASRRAERHE